ncbi:hypothetical protein JKF63_06022 [Porcisia hertigi]|uniref:Rab-GAP TBC domain-containing protein n=1 Tax=Porcisia hertigi TaxID=2761500 RepID=A0A836I792_9TRYP|nr:hypothetical protein JKF63_06022 [Porcisia hertigi]
MSDSLGSSTNPMVEREDGGNSPPPGRTLSLNSAPALNLAATFPLRHRHPSLERPRASSRVDQLQGAAEGDGSTSEERPLVFSPVRRRAVSQLSRRVKSETSHFLELAKGVVDGNAMPPQDFFGRVLYPISWYHLPDNCQPRVVEADIERSLWTLYPHSAERSEQRRRLKNMILRVLLHNPQCYYYQGLHELMGYMMHVLSPHMEWEEVVSVCEKLLVTRWKRFSTCQLKNSEAMLYAMHAIIAQEDPPLAAALEWCGVGPESHYAVSWVITWYVHNIENLDVLTRLFDYFVVDVEGSAIIYFTAALVIHQRETILEWINDANEEIGVTMSDTEARDDGIMLMARVYAQLSRLPARVLDRIDNDTLNSLVKQAEQYCALYRDTVKKEEENFLKGDVKRLGLLSNQQTRNAALRLLWHSLPREWRSPAKAARVRRVMFLASLMVIATAVAIGTATVDSKSSGWIHSVLRR